MKPLISTSLTLLTLLTLLLVLTNNAHAFVVEVNRSERKVFYHPTPDLNLSLTNLGEDGGLLFVSLDYDTPRSKSELAEIKAQYPNYLIQVVGADPVSPTARLEISKVGFIRELPLRNGQLGPYLNANMEIDKAQLERIWKLQDPESAIDLSLNVKTSYHTIRVLETFQAKSSYCEDLGIKTVGDLVLTFSSLPRPQSILYQQTFDSLKKSILEQCFEINEDRVSSFGQLLKSEVRVSRTAKTLLGQFTQPVDQEKVFNLKPRIKFEKN
jgi:hypothetical protein